jgi:cytochrome c biogenesis protein CcmG, thiol:disulfide interchange protein DsbE
VYVTPRSGGRLGAVAPIALLTLVVAVTGCAVSEQTGGAGQTSPAPTSSGPTGEARAGDPAPPLAGTTLDGATVDLASFRGRPIIVNFWASWCIPCRNEFPLLKAAFAKYGADGLTIVGTIFVDDEDDARRFAASSGATWPSLTDPTGGHARDWRVVAPPQTYFIGRDGIIASRQIGELTQADLDRQLAAILK